MSQDHELEKSAEKAERIREHLTRDPAALDRFLDLTAHVPGPEDPGHLSDEDLAADWEVIRRRLHLEDEPRTAKVVPFPSSGWRQVERIVALAAGLAVAVLGFLLWTVDQQVDEMSRRLVEPQVRTPYKLLPDGRRGDPGEEPSIWILLGENGAHLRFALYDLRALDSYRLEIHESRATEGSKPLWTTDEIVRSDEGTLEIGMPPDFLPPGEYLFRVYGIDDGQEEKLASYSVRF